MADKPETHTALWQQAISRSMQLSGSARKSEKDSEAEIRNMRTRYIERASEVLAAFLTSDEGRVAKELLRVTRQRIPIASFGYNSPFDRSIRGTQLYLNGDGLQYTSTVGDNITTLRAHLEHLVNSPNPFQIVSGYDELHKLIEKIRAELTRIAQESLAGTPPSPKRG